MTDTMHAAEAELTRLMGMLAPGRDPLGPDSVVDGLDALAEHAEPIDFVTPACALLGRRLAIWRRSFAAEDWRAVDEAVQLLNLCRAVQVAITRSGGVA